MKFKHIFLILMLLLYSTNSIAALTQEEQFIDGQNCYNSLDDAKKKFRHNWLVCIKKVKTAYKKDTKGEYAPVSLFYLAKLYKELYNISFWESDKKEAISNFDKLLNNYPNSAYSKKTKTEYKNFLSKTKPVVQKEPVITKKKPKKSTLKSDKKEQNKNYFLGINCYEKLLKKKKKTKEDFLDCIEKFRTSYNNHTTGGFASASLFQITRLYHHLDKLFPKYEYKNKAYQNYNALLKNFPKSKYAKEIKNKIKIEKPKRSLTKRPKKSKNSIKNFRFWSGPKYTRVVLDMVSKSKFSDKVTRYKENTFIEVKIKNVHLSSKIKRYTKIDDALLDDASLTEEKNNTVTLLLNIKNFEDYKIFYLNSPFRIVIDIWKVKDLSKGSKESKISKITPLDNIKDIARNGKKHDLIKQLALCVKKIVIDAGHGGIDVGALGAIKGTYEKNITLQIAKKVKEKIEKELKCKVIMTRDRDRTLSLEERTAIANKESADLFISIHTNANLNKHAYGIETYFLSLAKDRASVSLAARENAVSERSIGDLGMILNSLMKNSKINESKMLAEYVQKSMYKKIRAKYSKTRNKGVKQAPFYVLLGARMPAILIETSFISNKRECQLLKRADYQNDIAEGVVKGIKKYIDTL